jgi:hypothetical protein
MGEQQNSNRRQCMQRIEHKPPAQQNLRNEEPRMNLPNTKTRNSGSVILRAAFAGVMNAPRKHA